MTTAVLVLLLSTSQLPLPSPRAPTLTMVDWRNPGRCGTNCLFVLLQTLYYFGTHDQPVKYQDVARLLPSAPDRGCSLQDLASAAKQFGLDVDLRKVSLDDLPQLPTPFIAHLDLLERGGTGHFILVHSIGHAHGDVYVHYVDGSTGQRPNAKLSDLEPLLGGFVLVPRSKGSFPVQASSLLPMGLLGLGLGIGAGAFLVSRVSRIATSQP